MRVFAALEPSEAALDHLTRALELLGSPGPGRTVWIPRSHWHLTVAFYGEVPTGRIPSLTDDIAAATRELSPFVCALAGAGQFRHSTSWVGAQVDERAWRALVKAMAPSELGLGGRADPRARNRPHVTVSRARGEAALTHAMAALAVYRGPAWTAREVVVFESRLGQGAGGHPLYVPLTRCPFGGGDDAVVPTAG